MYIDRYTAVNTALLFGLAATSFTPTSRPVVCSNIDFPLCTALLTRTSITIVLVVALTKLFQLLLLLLPLLLVTAGYHPVVSYNDHVISFKPLHHPLSLFTEFYFNFSKQDLKKLNFKTFTTFGWMPLAVGIVSILQ